MRDRWAETTLDGIAEYINGYPFKPADLGEVGLPVIRIKQLLDPNEPVDRTNTDTPDRCLLRDGDIVFSWSGTLAVRIWNRGPAKLNQHLFRVVEKKGVYKGIIPLILEHAIEELEEKSHGTTMKHITKQTLLPHKVLLPPLPEQKRIVDLISSVDSYIEALQQQLECAKNSKSAYVNTIVSEIFARGKKTKIADIAEVKGGKRLPKATPWSEEPTDHRYIRATNIKDGIVLTENLVYVPDDVWPLISRYVVNQGDVVITIAGTIGQVGVIPTSLEGVNLTENAAKIVVNKKLVRSNYLSMLLGSNYYQQDIDSKTKKTTQPKLGLNMINSIEIPLPDLAEQDEIFSVVSQIDTLIAHTNNLILQTIALRTGLLSDLLSGEHEIPTSYDKVIGAA